MASSKSTQEEGSPNQTDAALVHGMYAPPADILAAFKARCKEQKIDFGKFRWAGPAEPQQYTDDDEVAVVLDVSLGDLAQTWHFAMSWLKAAYRLMNLPDPASEMRVFPEMLFQREDAEPFEPWTLRWRRLKLDAGYGNGQNMAHMVSFHSDIDPKLYCGMVGIFAVAEHPARFRDSGARYERVGLRLLGLLVELRQDGVAKPRSGWPIQDILICHTSYGVSVFTTRDIWIFFRTPVFFEDQEAMAWLEQHTCSFNR